MPTNDLTCPSHGLSPLEVQHPILGWIRYAPSPNDRSPLPQLCRCPQGCEWQPGRAQASSTVPAAPQAQPQSAPTREQQVREYVERAHPHIRSPQKFEFLVGLRLRGSVVHACEFANVGRRTSYDWRVADPGFAAAWNDCLEDAADALEASMYERGLSGDGMPNVVAGLAWLKTRRPEWNDKVQAARALAEAQANNPALREAAEWAGLVREQRLLIQAQRAALDGRDAGTIIEGQARELPAPDSAGVVQHAGLGDAEQQ